MYSSGTFAQLCTLLGWDWMRFRYGAGIFKAVEVREGGMVGCKLMLIENIIFILLRKLMRSQSKDTFLKRD